jgi:hypothetical protein
MAFDFVTRFAINPADSRLRRVLSDVALRLGAMPMQVTLASLLQRSPKVLVIPEHLRSSIVARIFSLQCFKFPLK